MLGLTAEEAIEMDEKALRKVFRGRSRELHPDVVDGGEGPTVYELNAAYEAVRSSCRAGYERRYACATAAAAGSPTTPSRRFHSLPPPPRPCNGDPATAENAVFPRRAAARLGGDVKNGGGSSASSPTSRQPLRLLRAVGG